MLYESDDPSAFAKAEEIELEIEQLENQIRTDPSDMVPWIAEWMTGIEKDDFYGDYS